MRDTLTEPGEDRNTLRRHRPVNRGPRPAHRGRRRQALTGALALTLLAPTAVAAQDDDPGAAGLGLMEVVRMTLEHDPAIALVVSQLAAAEGTLLSARGRFDPALTSSLTRSDQQALNSASDTETVRSAIGTSHQLRSGLELEPEIVLERSASADSISNQATVSFTLRQPLLRGRGRETVTAEERAAQRELAAARLELHHTTAQRLQTVVSQYWSVAAAALDLDILRATEERSRNLLATTRKLIAADLVPAAELVQLEADLAAREAARIGGERTLFAARQTLGREIGLETTQIPDLALPSDPFPEIAPVATTPTDPTALTRQALARRADLRAAQERLEAAEIRLRAAQDAVRIQLDLALTPSYSSSVSGDGVGDYFAPLYRDVPGLSTVLGFNLSWPIRNRTARGALIRAQEAREQSALRVALAERGIGAQVPVALDAVRRDALQLAKAVQAVGLFEQAVENEEKKLRGGTSTLIDVLSQRDRLTAARQRRVSAQLALALALVELRYQTGTLVAADGDTSAVSEDHLTTVPEVGE